MQRGWAEFFISRLYDHCFQSDTKQLLKNVPWSEKGVSLRSEILWRTSRKHTSRHEALDLKHNGTRYRQTFFPILSEKSWLLQVTPARVDICWKSENWTVEKYARSLRKPSQSNSSRTAYIHNSAASAWAALSIVGTFWHSSELHASSSAHGPSHSHAYAVCFST